MKPVEQLTFQCIQWRILLHIKEQRYSKILDPMARIIPAMHIIQTRIEGAMMEDELCTYLILPSICQSTQSSDTRESKP